jgi:hypothetical protein
VRPWIRRLAIYVLPLLAAFCALAVWDFVETRRLTREIDAIVARGEPITIGPLYSVANNSADNAEYRYSAAAVLALARDEIGDPTVAGRSAMDAYSRFSSFRTWLDGSGERPKLEDVDQATKKLLSEWQEAFSLVDRGATLPYHGVPAGTEYNYRVAGLWNVARLVSSRTIGLSLAADAEAAVDSAISALRLRRALRPSQRWLLVTAQEVPAILSVSTPSEEALHRLQTALADEEDPDGATRDFIEMRARMLNDAWLRIYRVAPGTPLPPAFPGELLPSSGMRPRVTHDFVGALRAWSELAEIAKKPWPERMRLAAEPIARYGAQARPSRYINVGLVAGIFYQTIRPDLLVHDRSSRVAVAVERYRRTHNDALPPSLNDLVPQYLESIPQDPLTGQQLRYRVAKDAYVVYSVGPDGNDDGGLMLRHTPPSPTVQFPSGADMGIRVLIRHR